MKKDEFISKLREKLDILDEKEIQDIIEEYTGYINEKIQKGIKEEDAIKDFGDIDELVTELLKAYKINVDKNKSDKNFLNNVVNTLSNWMDNIIKLFSHKSSNEIIKMIFEILIIIIGICLCKIPFQFLEDLGYDVFLVLKNSIGLGLFHIWKFILELAYLIFAIVLFAKIFQKRYLENLKEEPEKLEKKSKPIKKITKEENKIEENNSKRGVIDLLATIGLYCIKFLVFWVLIGIGFYIVGLGITVGISAFLIIKGVDYYGIYLSLLLLLILGVLSFIGLFNWFMNRRNNVTFLLIGFIISFMALGISFSYASIEVASTTFINEKPDSYIKDETIELLTMNPSLILNGRFQYEVDESLEDQIKITYQYYSNLTNFQSILEEEDPNEYYLSWDYDNPFNTIFFEDIINDLKQHTIHDYSLIPDIIVTTSSENIKQLKENKRKSRVRYSYDIEDCYEVYHEYGYEYLNSYCKSKINGKIESWEMND